MAEDESPIQGFHMYTVGELFGIDFHGQELVTYNYSQGGHLLTVAMPNMTEREEQELRSGTAQFALTVKNGIIFLLSKFGEMPWMDAPFQWWLNPPASRMMPPSLSPSDRILMSITAVDSVTNCIRVLRAVTPSQEFSRALIEAVRRQARSSWEGAAKHDRQIAKIYRRLTTRDLLRQATVVSDASEETWTTATFPEVASLDAIARYVYTPSYDMDLSAMPTVFNAASFADFHRNYAIPVEAEDDDPIDIERNAAVGALKLQEVLVDGNPRRLWVVQPGFYSEDFGLELPE